MTNLSAAIAGEIERLCNVRALFVHAHPDDETLQTGSLISWMSENNATLNLVTMTRGERGEVVEGVLPKSITNADLVRARLAELNDACRLLGIGRHFFLGSQPARAEGLVQRTYTDSGMAWVSDGVAGPAADASSNCLVNADIDEAVEDLKAAFSELDPGVVISYDNAGSYHHPDHIRTYEIVKRACDEVQIPRFEIASNPNQPGFTYLDLSSQETVLRQALSVYRTQLSLCGDEIVHVGGQRQALPTIIGIRET